MLIIDDSMSTKSQPAPKFDKVHATLAEREVMQAHELIALGISREYLRKLTEQGILERVRQWNLSSSRPGYHGIS